MKDRVPSPNVTKNLAMADSVSGSGLGATFQMAVRIGIGCIPYLEPHYSRQHLCISGNARNSKAGSFSDPLLFGFAPDLKT
jgi:hypothetical protein